MNQGIITALSHEGRGIIKASGQKTIFVDFALNGEEVTYDIYKEHSKFDEAKVVNVLSPSPHRVPPPCPYFGTCGGCSLQHMNHTTQMELKQSTLLEHLKHYANLVPEKILPPLWGPLWHYRHKAQLSVHYADSKATVGFKAINSHTVVDIKKCLILPETINLEKISDLINALSILDSVYAIDIAVGDDNTALILQYKKSPSSADLEKISEFAKTNQVHIYMQPKGISSISKLYPKDDDAFLTYTIDGMVIKFHPAEFTQINPEMNQKMVKQALDLLNIQQDDNVLDLYCGVGNFSLPMAKIAASVTGIEGVNAMVKRARDNATANNITNTKFFPADLQKNKITWSTKKYTKLLIDPPRAGANMTLVLSLNIPEILYVSCDAATLARDAKILGENGYTLKAAGIMDMFSHTKHVESLALFRK